MSFVKRRAHGVFDVDWAARGGWTLLRKGNPVDPKAVADAVLAVMRGHSMQGVRGEPLLTNDFRVVLSPEDFRPLTNLTSLILRDLPPLIASEAQKLKGEFIGTVVVHVHADEGGDLLIGHATIRADFLPDERPAAVVPGEITVRVPTLRPPGPAEPESKRVIDLPGGIKARFSLRWPDGFSPLSPGTRHVIGRNPGETAGDPRFIGVAPPSATKIKRRHLWMEATGQSVLIGRYSDANPVHVGGVLVAPGTEMEVQSFPVGVSLSNDELVLWVEGG